MADMDFGEMYRSGQSLSRIAEQAGLSVGTIVARLEAAGVERRPVGRVRKYATAEEARIAAEAQRKQRYSDNQEEILLKSAVRYQQKRLEILANESARRAADPEKYRKKNRDSYWQNRDVRLEAAKKYGRDNPGKRYGLSKAEFEALEKIQNGVCAICKKPPDAGRRLCVDHDHVTGKVRGLLCTRHNLLLGMADDSPSLLRESAAYLEPNA